jgi:tRNA-dihydrouridine synthase B
MSLLAPSLPTNRPALILAPMQDVTDLPFMGVIHRRGDPDLYFTEYFRVHRDSRPERHILRSIDENPTGRPIIAQMIGVDIPSLVRTATKLQRHPIAAIDLNLGCPAPIVCSKNAGGGLLRNPQQIDEILGALRSSIGCGFTVKTRVGFDSPEEFPRLLEVFARHDFDALTVHGRTVREMYRTAVHLGRIRDAVGAIARPVFANGNVLSVRLAKETIDQTGAAGLMIGRGAIRNPWIFRQLREEAEGRPVFEPTLRDVREYIEDLFHAVRRPDGTELGHVAKMKKYLNFIGQGIGEEEAFLREVRRVATEREFWDCCDRHLLSDERMPAEPPQRALLDARSERMDQELVTGSRA